MGGRRRTAYLMVAPALAVVLAIVAYPLAFATYYSLREVRGNLVGGFVGLSNYAAIARDADFAEALSTTLLFTAASAGLSFLAGLGLALLLSRPFFGRGAVAAAVFLPWIFPAVATGTFGRLALGDGGFAQDTASVLGLFGGGPLLGERGVLFAVAVLADAWRTAPFVALLLLAGLRTIPKDVYEAASVEGANAIQRFFRITLPLLGPTILIALLIRLLDAFRVHDLFWVLGGRELESLSIYVYRNVLLSQVNFGLGSAAAVFVFACAFATALFFAVVLRARVSTGLARSGLQATPDEPSVTRVDARGGPLLAAGALLALGSLAPVAWVFWTSATPPDPSGPLVDGSGSLPSLVMYPLMLSDPDVATGLANGAFIAGSVTLVTLLLACPAAYSVARLGLRRGDALLGAMLAVAFFPPAAVLVPMLVQLRTLGIIGTQLGAVVPHAVFFLPFAIWLLATFFRELPVEVEDAARVDGATRMQVLTRVILPLAAPAVFAAGAFVFVLSWNEFVFASTFTFGASRPITVVLADLVAAAGFSVGPPAFLAAVSVLATLPPVVLFLFFRRRILAGLTGVALAEAPVRRTPTRATPARVGSWAATALLLAAGVWALALFARYGWQALAFPYPLNYGEGPLLDQAVRLAGFENVYRADLSEPPFTVANYPPIFALLQAPLVWIFGPEYWYGRGISLLGTVATALLISLTVNVLTRDRVASAASGLVFLAVPFVLQWASLSRVDMLGLALSWAGLYVVARHPGRRRAVVLAALLMVAAAYTRQTYALAAPLAASVYLFGRGRRREAATLVAVAGGTGLVLLGALGVATGGGFFFHTVTANLNEFRPELLGFHFFNVVGQAPLLLAGAAAYLVLAPWSGGGARALVAPYLLAAVATALLIGKIGSDVNYLLELSAALALVAGALLARYARRPGLRAALLLALALQCVLMVQAAPLNTGFRDATVANREDLSRLREIVAEADGPVLADEAMGLLPLEGRRIRLQPFEMTQLAREGKWDQGPLLRRISDGEYAAVLIFEPPGARFLVEERWTEEMLAEIEANYEPAERLAGTTVYRPRE